MSRSFLPLSFLALLSAACTSQAGPFVTQIRYAGPGLIAVEKCMVEFTKFTNTISTEDCGTEVIAVGPQPGAPPQQMAPQVVPMPPPR